MNFFGHATVAFRQRAEPRFVLGAMLPDFCGMAGVRMQALADEELARGVTLHHETDRAFHRAPEFLALCASALAELEAAGVARASARAVGHVGSELLLDGLLSFDADATRAYAEALEAALSERLELGVVFHADGHAARMRTLWQRLSAAPLPLIYRDPTHVCDRLYAILAPRPRLMLAPRDREPVLAWLRGAAGELERVQPALLAAVMPDQGRDYS